MALKICTQKGLTEGGSKEEGRKGMKEEGRNGRRERGRERR